MKHLGSPSSSKDYSRQHSPDFKVARLQQLQPLDAFHEWANYKPLVSADRIERGDGTAFFLLLIDWQERGEFYCILYPSTRTRPLAELWRVERNRAGTSLVWTYKPRKQDGRNRERVAYFRRHVGDTTVKIAMPTRTSAVPRFFRHLFDLTENRTRADRLDSNGSETAVEFQDGQAGTSTPNLGTRRGQGYATDPLVNKAVEEHAMQCAVEHFRRAGYHVEDTSATHSFDLRCRRGTDVVRIEVKGLQGDPDSVLLTATEVAAANSYDCRTDLFVVFGIEVASDNGAVRTSGGEVLHVSRWRPHADDLVPERDRYMLHRYRRDIDRASG